MMDYDRDRTVIEIITDGGESGSTEFRIPVHGSSSFEGGSRRHNRDSHCRKFHSEEGCPHGDSCNLLHDELSTNRETDAISLVPSGYSGRGSDGGGGGRGSGSAIAGVGGRTGGRGGNAATAGNGANSKPFNWKTVPCNKWKMTGYCPLGDKCHFAHGATELHRYGGRLMVGERRDSGSAIATRTIQQVPPSQRPSTAIQRLSTEIQRPGQRTRGKWPRKLNGIYGDWIDDSI